MPIDFNLYTKFWSLQEFFSKPNNCFDKIAWKSFTNVRHLRFCFFFSKKIVLSNDFVSLKNANDVLEALKSYRLEEDIKGNSKVDEFDDMSLYFSKYLTREKVN